MATNNASAYSDEQWRAIAPPEGSPISVPLESVGTEFLRVKRSAGTAPSQHSEWTEQDTRWMRDLLFVVAHMPDAFQVEHVSPCLLLWSHSMWCGGLLLPPRRTHFSAREVRWGTSTARAGAALFGWGLVSSQVDRVFPPRLPNGLGFDRPPILSPACTWCGIPTGNWCEDIKGAWWNGDRMQECGRPVCSTCEDIKGGCRSCEGP
jgi:hypothetical protein